MLIYYNEHYLDMNSLAEELRDGLESIIINENIKSDKIEVFGFNPFTADKLPSGFELVDYGSRDLLYACGLFLRKDDVDVL